jgi:hypothetical protein
VVCTGVDLYPVEAAVGQPAGGGRVALDQPLDLLDGQSGRRLLLMYVEDGGEGDRRSGYPLGDVGVDSAPGAAVVELHEAGDAALVDLLGQVLDVLEVLVVIHSEPAVALVGQRPFHGRGLDDDHARAALGHSPVEGLGQWSEAAVSGIEQVGLSCGLDDPVLQLHLADADGRVDVLVLGNCHQLPPQTGSKIGV